MVLAATLSAAACGPETPQIGTSSTSVTDAGGDARLPVPTGSDAALERSAPLTSGSGGTQGCAPTGAGGGGLAPSIADGGSGDAGRDAGMDAALGDVRGTDDAVAATGGRAGGSGGTSGIGAGGGTGGAAVAGGTGGTGGPAAAGGAGGGGPIGSGGLPGLPGSGGAGTGGRAGTGAATGTGGAMGTGGGGVAGVAGTGGAANAGGAAGGAAVGAGGSGNVAPSPGPGEVAIVELLINPASTDTGREWIEIVNRSGHAVSLAGLQISDAANSAAVDFGTTASGGVLASGARMVLIQSGDATKNGGIVPGGAIPVGTFGTLVSLNNDADTISICLGACATGPVVDRVAWDATLGTGYDGHALVIDDSARRCPATAPFGDAGSFGTPGAANAMCP